MSLAKILKKEVADFAIYQRRAERRMQPLFLDTLNQTMEPLFRYVDQFGLENVPVEQLITVDAWEPMYLRAFNDVGLPVAENEYRWQEVKELDAMEGKAFGFPQFLVDIWSGTMRDYALKYVYGITRELTNTTVELITKALGEDYGFEIDRVGKVRLFRKRVGEATTVRSFTISRTETTTISNLGKELAAREWISDQGGQGYKTWLGRIANERPEHLILNNTILPINEPYKMVIAAGKGVGSYDCDRPGDVNLPAKLRINCRCTQSIISERAYNQYLKRGLIRNGKVIF